MSNQEFALAIDHHLTNAERDALYEAGVDDIAIQLRSDQTVIRFDREADTLADALQSALADVTRAGLKVVAVQAGKVAAA